MCRSLFIFTIFCLSFTLLFNQSNAICHGNDTHLLPSIVVTEDLTSTDFDAIIVVASEISSIAFDGLKDPLAYFLSRKNCFYVLQCPMSKLSKHRIFVIFKKCPFKSTSLQINDQFLSLRARDSKGVTKKLKFSL